MQKDGQIETKEQHGLEKKKIEMMHKDQLQSSQRQDDYACCVHVLWVSRKHV